MVPEKQAEQFLVQSVEGVRRQLRHTRLLEPKFVGTNGGVPIAGLKSDLTSGKLHFFTSPTARATVTATTTSYDGHYDYYYYYYDYHHGSLLLPILSYF